MRTAWANHLMSVNSRVECIAHEYRNSESSNEVDLFYRFILDLFGQSQDGKLFQKKLENESEEERSASIFSKILAGVTILALNIFFCTYVILKAYVKESTWQTLYINLCIFQIVTEVFVFSSVECVLLHFTLPSLAFDGVVHYNTSGRRRIIGNRSCTRPFQHVMHIQCSSASLRLQSTRSSVPTFIRKRPHLFL